MSLLNPTVISNVTLSTPCSQNSFGQFVATLFLTLITLITIAGNLFVIIAILTNKRLQILSNYLIFSLSVTDLVLGLIVMPLRIVEDIYYYDKWIFGGFLCNAVVFIRVSTYLTSMLHIFGISVDRYLCVTSLKYMQTRSKKNMIVIISLAWGIALTLTALPLLGLRNPGQFEKGIERGACRYSGGVSWYFPLLYWSCIGVPLIIMIPLHIAIYRVSSCKRFYSAF